MNVCVDACLREKPFWKCVSLLMFVPKSVRAEKVTENIAYSATFSPFIFPFSSTKNPVFPLLPSCRNNMQVLKGPHLFSQLWVYYQNMILTVEQNKRGADRETQMVSERQKRAENSHIFEGSEEQGECGKKETNRSNQIIKLLLIRMNEGSRACLGVRLCVRFEKISAD